MWTESKGTEGTKVHQDVARVVELPIPRPSSGGINREKAPWFKLQQAFNRLGLSQWDGIEQDIAWGHVTSLMGLLRPSINGPIFVYRAPCRIGGQFPPRVRVVTTTTSGPEPILEEIASHFEDLADPEERTSVHRISTNYPQPCQGSERPHQCRRTEKCHRKTMFNLLG